MAMDVDVDVYMWINDTQARLNYSYLSRKVPAKKQPKLFSACIACPCLKNLGLNTRLGEDGRKTNHVNFLFSTIAGETPSGYQRCFHLRVFVVHGYVQLW